MSHLLPLRRPHLALVAGALLLAGCQAAPPAVPATPAMAAPAPQGPRLQLMGLPATWTQAVVSLYSTSVNGPYTPGIHALNVGFTPTDAGEAFLPLPDLPFGGQNLAHAAVAAGGKFYVVDKNTSSVARYNANGSADAGFVVGGLNNPTQVAVGPGGQVYVVERGLMRVSIFTPNGAANGSISVGGATCFGLAVDAGGNVYVSENTAVSGNVRKYNAAGTLVATIASLDAPGGLAVDAAGNLAVGLGGTSNRVAIYDPNFVPRPLAAPVSVTGSDYGVAFDNAGNLYVQDAAFVRKYGPTGVHRNAFDAGTPLTALAVDPLTSDVYAVASTAVKVATQGSSYRSSSVLPFGPLRPAADYVGRVFLQESGRLLGSAQIAGLSLVAGANAPTFTITPNAQAWAPGVAGSTTFTHGTTQTLRTGIQNGQPGVARVDILLSGSCYVAGTALITSLTDPAAWQTFSWNSAGVAAPPSTFLPGQFQAGTGQLTIQAYTDHGEVVGSTITGITVN